jgi:saccharopine dehydrogenase-like NADP-dependent oxidoreductase
MKQILLFGAGKSATVLIDYLLANAAEGNWKLIVVDADMALARSKISGSPYGIAQSFDITDDIKRKEYINKADIVISMLPPVLHFLVAKDCLEYSKHLLTASYIDEQVKSLEKEIADKKVLFLCEMGLDPGIDHMSAMKLIDEIHSTGGKVISFRSHCGGLVAPESDDNPWHYKISWNPRNIVLAGKAGAHYRENGKEIRLKYEELFSADKMVDIPGIGYLSWYPNRDSLSYTSLYGLEDTATFIRTTLRHPDFMYGWKNIIDLKLTDEQWVYETDGKNLAAVFKEHLDKSNFGDWLQKKMTERFKETQDMLTNLTRLMEAEKEAENEGEEVPESFISADAKGNLEEIEIDDVKTKAAAFVAHKMHEANLILKQLVFLGLDDEETMVNKGICNAADILQFAVEKKLGLKAEDKDMIVMLHELEYSVSSQQSAVGSQQLAVGSRQSVVKSWLVVKGEDNLRTAMAKTVGLPLGIAAKLILNGQINLTGLHIPTVKEIYEPVLKELESAGIRFTEE